MNIMPKPRMDCPLDAAMSIIEGRWKTVILCKLGTEKRPLRFKELMEIDGISARILTKQLKEMEADGLIRKSEYCDNPVRYEYYMTAKAESLGPILIQLAEWGRDNMFSRRVIFDASVEMPGDAD